MLELNTKINLNYKGISYTLEYNRMAIKMIENDGFSLESFSSQPMTMIDLAFKGAFYKNHRKVQNTLMEEIYDHCPDKEKLIESLTAMIAECYNSLTKDPSEDNEGNATWEVVDLTPKANQK